MMAPNELDGFIRHNVMAGLGPAIHDFGRAPCFQSKAWLPGPSPGMTIRERHRSPENQRGSDPRKDRTSESSIQDDAASPQRHAVPRFASL
jgi:hypothetical protein